MCVSRSLSSAEIRPRPVLLRAGRAPGGAATGRPALTTPGASTEAPPAARALLKAGGGDRPYACISLRHQKAETARACFFLRYGMRRSANNVFSMHAATALGVARRSQSKQHGADYAQFHVIASHVLRPIRACFSRGIRARSRQQGRRSRRFREASNARC